MSHYAKVNNGKVEQVIVAEADFFKTFIDSSPGQWIQTSYNTKGGIHYGQDGKPDGGVALRANYAGIGYMYDATNDVFYAPRPLDMNSVVCNSWTISAPTWIWTAPVEYPTDGKIYTWDESTKNWILVTQSS
jgi:hypothetical protein